MPELRLRMTRMQRLRRPDDAKRGGGDGDNDERTPFDGRDIQKEPHGLEKPARSQRAPPALVLAASSSSTMHARRPVPAPSIALTLPPPLCEGWVLKKRRKKMQGFARRYFTLSHTGVLSYSFGPGQQIRDHVPLPHAAISTSPGRKDIHIDSNTATFHIKCLGPDDFDMWMAAFRKFIVLGNDSRRSASMRLAVSVVGPRKASINAVKSAAVVEEMGKTIVELEQVIRSLSSQQDVASHRKHHSGKGKPFGLFRKTSHPSLPTEMGEQAHGSSKRSSRDPVVEYPPIERLQAVLNAFQAQHASLSKAFTTTPDSSLVLNSPLPLTAEEDELSPMAMSWRSERVSMATSGSGSEWFDALEDGPHEFVLDETGETPDEEQPSRIVTDDSTSSFHSASGEDTDDEATVPASPLEASVATYDPSSIVRRTTLPSPQPADEGSLFAVLKKNVGKDLSTISMPVTFNEPLTLLQRAAEEMEYYDLLTQAAATQDPVERMAYIAAFAVSSYAHTRHRSMRKGFNPMLAETFEDVRMKFVAEKVSHHPLIIAQHAQASSWQLTATTIGKTKFWGKSLEVIPLGVTHVKIGEDHYHWRKPSSFVRNLMVGQKYLEHVGKMTIENTKDNMTCALEFKNAGYWGPSNVVEGAIMSSSGMSLTELEGKWDESFAQKIDPSTLRVLWRAAPFPKTLQDYYGFTFFSLTLNEITSDLHRTLPPTDSRLRPDVRALEEGRIEDAEEQKLKLEEAQRERRMLGTDIHPRWFKQTGSEDEWEYLGGYWESKAKGWKDTALQSLW